MNKFRLFCGLVSFLIAVTAAAAFGILWWLTVKVLIANSHLIGVAYSDEMLVAFFYGFGALCTLSLSKYVGLVFTAITGAMASTAFFTRVSWWKMIGVTIVVVWFAACVVIVSVTAWKTIPDIIIAVVTFPKEMFDIVPIGGLIKLLEIGYSLPK